MKRVVVNFRYSRVAFFIGIYKLNVISNEPACRWAGNEREIYTLLCRLACIDFSLSLEMTMN
ncbi:MAG: hypothetical protein JWR50_1701 [Mucilaginibacter sp.]|nr:hypothetical protein [Mucilaginibacter sp.]